jgi:osmotically-inducible protein OsmY
MKKRSDPELQSAVEREIELDERVGERDVQVRVDGGIVTLSGQACSCARRAAAQDAAHRVAGVFDVVNEIQVQPAAGPRRSDAEIARAVRDTLEWEVFVPEEQIHSTVSAGRVTLEGRVALHRERDDVARAVRNLVGVVSVINRIEVVTPPVAADDLRKAIQAALQRQVEREVNGIELDVEEGRVVLRGVVRSWREREAVLGAVKGTRGVRNIEHTIRVDPEN